MSNLTETVTQQAVKMRRQVHPTVYTSTVATTQRIISKEGVRSLFKGVLPPMLAQGFTNAVLFGSASYCNQHVNFSRCSKYDKALYSGMVAGVTVSFADCPVELVKTKLQGQGMGRMSTRTDQSMSSMARHIVKHGGVRGIYQVKVQYELPFM